MSGASGAARARGPGGGLAFALTLGLLGWELGLLGLLSPGPLPGPGEVGARLARDAALLLPVACGAVGWTRVSSRRGGSERSAWEAACGLSTCFLVLMMAVTMGRSLLGNLPATADAPEDEARFLCAAVRPEEEPRNEDSVAETLGAGAPGRLVAPGARPPPVVAPVAPPSEALPCAGAFPGLARAGRVAGRHLPPVLRRAARVRGGRMSSGGPHEALRGGGRGRGHPPQRGGRPPAPGPRVCPRGGAPPARGRVPPAPGAASQPGRVPRAALHQPAGHGRGGPAPRGTARHGAWGGPGGRLRSRHGRGARTALHLRPRAPLFPRGRGGLPAARRGGRRRAGAARTLRRAGARARGRDVSPSHHGRAAGARRRRGGADLPPHRSGLSRAVLLHQSLGLPEEVDVRSARGALLPVLDEMAGPFRAGTYGFNYRSEPRFERDEEDEAEPPRAVREPALFRSYLGESVKLRGVPVGSAELHLLHVHGWDEHRPAGPRPRDPSFEQPRVLTPGGGFTLTPSGPGPFPPTAGDFLIHCHMPNHSTGGERLTWRVFSAPQPSPRPRVFPGPLSLSFSRRCLAGCSRGEERALHGPQYNPSRLRHMEEPVEHAIPQAEGICRGAAGCSAENAARVSPACANSPMTMSPPSPLRCSARSRAWPREESAHDRAGAGVRRWGRDGRAHASQGLESDAAGPRGGLAVHAAHCGRPDARCSLPHGDLLGSRIRHALQRRLRPPHGGQAPQRPGETLCPGLPRRSGTISARCSTG